MDVSISGVLFLAAASTGDAVVATGAMAGLSADSELVDNHRVRNFPVEEQILVGQRNRQDHRSPVYRCAVPRFLLGGSAMQPRVGIQRPSIHDVFRAVGCLEQRHPVLLSRKRHLHPTTRCRSTLRMALLAVL